MNTIITAKRTFDRKDLRNTTAKATQIVAESINRELFEKLYLHLQDGSPWLVQMTPFVHRDGILTTNREVTRQIGVSCLAELRPLLEEFNRLVNNIRLDIELHQKTKPGEPYKFPELDKVQVAAQGLVVLLAYFNFPITRPEVNGGTGEAPASAVPSNL